MGVKVINLATGTEQVYTCSPEQAVIAAYEQARNNYNTWDDKTPEQHPEFDKGKWTVRCGDFCAYTSLTP